MWVGDGAVTAWLVWRQPMRVLAVLAVVEGLALAVPVATWSPISTADLALALMLVSLTVTYSQFVVGWEKARRLLLFQKASGMTPDILATWCFASALLLPPALAAAVTAVSGFGDYKSYNPAGVRALYRHVYSKMAAVLAASVTSWLFRRHLMLVEALPAAAATWVAIGAGATGLAMCASGQFDAARRLLRFGPHRLEVVTVAVAMAEYGAYLMGRPMFIWLSLPAAVGIQRHFTTAELRSQESVAQPMVEDAWNHVAKVVVEANVTVTVLIIDAPDPQAARMVAMMQGGCDAIGTYANGSGLAILLPDCPPPNGDALARRLRIAMKHHKVRCNIASASKSRDGQSLEDLLAVCEAELVVSRQASSRSTNWS
jgi:hypothetical protein